MKKYGKRIVAFALAMVVALGSVCYKPPKAEAFVGGMLANMCLSAYMTATGISLTPNEETAEAMNSLLNSLIPEFVKDYAKEVSDFTADTFRSIIENGSVIKTTGFLGVNQHAAALMGRFTGWVVSRYKPVDEETGTPVKTIPMVLPDNVKVPVTIPEKTDTETGEVTPEEDVELDHVPYWDQICAIIADNATNSTYYDLEDYKYYLIGLMPSGSIYFFVSTSPFIYKAKGTTTTGMWTFGCNVSILLRSGTDNWLDYGWEGSRASGTWVFYAEDNFTPIVANHVIVDETGEFDPVSVAVTTVSATDKYESPPVVEDGYSLEIDTGVTYVDDDSFIDSVLTGSASGTLAPSYTIVVTPSEGEDTEDETAGILDWTKKIWQSIQEIPQSIADAVGGIFVPSAEYMVALPETVTATFDDRTGFLTYPVSVLYDFADRLTAGQQDFILEWPTVNEPYSGGQLMAAGQFNVSKYVRDNDFASDIYTIYQWVVGGYLSFLFFGLCRRKYNSVIGDSLGG